MSFFLMISTHSWRIFLGGLCGEVFLDLTKLWWKLAVRFPPRLTNISLGDGHILAFPGGNLRALRRFGGPAKLLLLPSRGSEGGRSEGAGNGRASPLLWGEHTCLLSALPKQELEPILSSAPHACTVAIAANPMHMGGEALALLTQQRGTCLHLLIPQQAMGDAGAEMLLQCPGCWLREFLMPFWAHLKTEARQN